MALIASILSKFDDTGIRRAKKGFASLKGIMAGIGAGFAIAELKQVGEFMMDAAKAAEADKKSMQLLNSQLTKNAHATKGQIKQNDQFIETLSTQVGIIDDNLRPAQAKLARATGSVSQSQKLLKLALDASAVSGKPLEAVVAAIARAYNGNTGALARMFPELKKSKDALADLNKEVAGAAAQQADPFAKLNVAMDNLKEKLGYAILPYIEDIIKGITKPGGAMDTVNKFLDDTGKPATEAGKAFKTLRKIIDDNVKDINNVLKLFGGGDSLKGFERLLNIVAQISDYLDKIHTGILYLNPFGALFNVTMQGMNATDNTKPKAPQGNQIVNINVHGADPKATVDAVSRYLAQNGGKMPSKWGR